MLFVSCKKGNQADCFKSTGSQITEQRNPGRFDTIRLFDNITITIIQGSDYNVAVTAGKHIIKNIYTHVANGVLTIDNNNKCNVVRGYKHHVTMTITVPRINKVENMGVGTVYFDADYHQDTLLVAAESSGDVHVSGTYNEIRTSSQGNGDMYLSGTVNSLYVFTNGINFLKAEHMTIAGFVFIETLSIGDCYVSLTGATRLDYNIHETGNIYYSGTPAAINNLGSGSEKGKLIQK